MMLLTVNVPVYVDIAIELQTLGDKYTSTFSLGHPRIKLAVPLY
jgi:hypothetical protein